MNSPAGLASRPLAKPNMRYDVLRLFPKECPMRLGIVLAFVALLAASPGLRGDDRCAWRCVSQCLQSGYSEPAAPDTDSIENDDASGAWLEPGFLKPQTGSRAGSTAPDWGPF